MHHNHQAIVNLFSGLGPVCLAFDAGNDHTVYHLKERLSAVTNIPVDEQRISTMGGRPLGDDDVMFQDPCGPVVFNLSLRLRGGKGGFGSMLRAQGGRMNAQKTTNFEACRDLQGRRIRTVNEAKRLQEELEAIPLREKEKREQLQKKIEKALKEPETKRYRFEDTQFLDDCEQILESVKSAVSTSAALQQNKKVAKPAKPVSMFDDDDDEEEDEDRSEEEAMDVEGGETTPPTSASSSDSPTETTTAAQTVKKDKGKGKAVATGKRGRQSHDEDEGSDDEENKRKSAKKVAYETSVDDQEKDDDEEEEEETTSKALLEEFMTKDYDEEDSEDDGEFQAEEEESSEEEEEEEEEEEAISDEVASEDESAPVGSSSASSSKPSRKRKAREE
ncbi:hypothetical protein EC973_008464 [Apophysomyces ossiformis]|uniref:Ubiquitin-like domain-containing protein n=1 Tax=Apophysomyces ossiformis TaxID=679940 RepID=A0A8H7BL40_9FUNG|nr:hypothetical protein EC973_008464 [Apophysomyces ossiformis]